TGKTLDAVLTPALSKAFLGGDVGVYVNAAAMGTRHADQIDQAKQAMMASLDQAGQQMGNAATMEFAKTFYGGAFDAVKQADALALNLDFAGEGLGLAGIVTVKPGSDLAKSIAASSAGSSADLGRFAPDAAFYAYMNVAADTLHRLQGMSLGMLGAGGKPTPEQERALADLGSLGRVETWGAVIMRDGIRGLNIVNASGPKKFIAGTKAMMLALKGGEGPLNVYKDIKVEDDAKTFRGFTFTRIVATFDLDKLAKLSANNPGGAAGMKAMLGGDAMT